MSHIGLHANASWRCWLLLLLLLLQDRFDENKEQLQDVLNEIVTLKQLQ
jgi:hypothetical protein